MTQAATLPSPNAAARAHSEALTASICRRINDAGGWIDFSEYMHSALYEPALGYYTSGATKFGGAGDFVTAPEVSPLFARCVAASMAATLTSLGDGDVVEFGAGSGALAADVLTRLIELERVPRRYAIVEVSAELRDRQRRRLAALPDWAAERVVWIDQPPEEPFDGIVFANEVADALPVTRFRRAAYGWVAEGVATDGERFVWSDGKVSADHAARIDALRLSSPQGFVSELCPSLGGWVHAATSALRNGEMLLFDYGLPRREYYRAERSGGTLRCHYRHRAHDDPFFLPGLQDITAWVDFTAVALAADAAGLDVSGFTTQAQFLIDSGLEREIAESNRVSIVNQASVAAQVRQLTMPGEMGEAIKAMALTRNVPTTPRGFGGRDLRHLL